MPELHWEAVGRTDTGRVRKHNEDSILLREDGTLWCVADGMGGHGSGEVASQLITSTLQRIKTPAHLADAIDSVDRALQSVHRALGEQGEKRGQIIGSTALVAIPRAEYLAILWAGDSRAYLQRGAQCHNLTTDHTQLQAMVDRGLVPPEEAEDHPAGRMVTRAVGAPGPIMVDVEVVRVEPGDRLLLASDGLGKHVADRELAGLLRSTTDPRHVVDRIIATVLERGAGDNVSVVVADFRGAAESPRGEQAPA
ncbi:MAG: serine/threonine-protein phosphatase [Gammaproteobacteria bacterium]|nr:serine/threonine-protein phosphatase [Gammaproteobacteria bacterium]MCP5201258.1 serine/threonine-protein phosphatase [Gammaproteobacteria bacterium]